MSAYYPGRTVYRYPSKIDDDHDDKTADAARIRDRRRAIEIISAAAQAAFVAPLRDGDPLLVKALRVLADDIESLAQETADPLTAAVGER